MFSVVLHTHNVALHNIHIAMHVNFLKLQNTILHWATQGCSCLRHYAIRQKVADSIPNGVTEIFHWLKPSGCTIALRSTQPLREMNTRDIFQGGVQAVSIEDWQPYHLQVSIV